ncbi:MAG TPA: tautomerase family protein, partial [Beijerinckiaceae bacterium]|nr:tautomerase family protein [Beijerinckiaceae bacterium]
MPFVRIDLQDTVAPTRRRAIADAVHAALVESIGIPAEDRFQVVSSHGDELIYDPGYLGIERTDGIVMVEVHLSVGRSLDLKRALYAAVAERLAALGIRKQDVFVHLMETTLLNWSFGDGA